MNSKVISMFLSYYPIFNDINRLTTSFIQIIDGWVPGQGSGAAAPPTPSPTHPLPRAPAEPPAINQLNTAIDYPIDAINQQINAIKLKNVIL